MTTDLRIKSFGDIDPLAVPLPNGTQVSTRIDRIIDDRRIPRGAVGKVIGVHGDEVEIDIVGVGRVRYQRDEVLPRKPGQMRFAQRRETAWAALRPCAVLETTVGSHAWGLADEKSDVDIRGVFALPLPWTHGLGDPPRDLVSADGSSTYWECGKAVRQAVRADPNTLELLFVPGVRVLDPIGEWLVAERDSFVSTEIYGSFGRYALSQLRKLQHSLRLAEHRTTLLDWLRADPAQTLDGVATRLAAVSTRSAPTVADAELQAKQYVKQLCRSLYDQGLLPTCDFAGLVTFAEQADAGFELPRDLRPKNAYNLLRLIGTAVQWLKTGSPTFEVVGGFRDRLLAIKTGDVSLADVLKDAEAMTPELEAARHTTRLPAHPDVGRADALLRRIGEEIARRFIVRDPGPFGKNAIAPPPVSWEDSR